jgi:UPF0042 nucleotide-binding protein
MHDDGRRWNHAAMNTHAPTLVIVSGMSGSGKSIGLSTLEDLGFYCVDNLPAELLPAFVSSVARDDGAPEKLAVVIDARNRNSDLANIPDWLSAVGALGLDPKLVFFDTSTPNEHQLRRQVTTEFGLPGDSALSLLFESFAYKRGVPPDADFVFDARVLPNPHWNPELRPLSGRDAEVRAYLESQADVTQYIAQVTQFLDTWLPKLRSDTRSYVTVAFGCTGGRHRSVYLAEQLAQHCREHGWNEVAVHHRELD